jgi:hypothetical protein
MRTFNSAGVLFVSGVVILDCSQGMGIHTLS